MHTTVALNRSSGLGHRPGVDHPALSDLFEQVKRGFQYDEVASIAHKLTPGSLLTHLRLPKIIPNVSTVSCRRPHAQRDPLPVAEGLRLPSRGVEASAVGG
jgi:hypothetical protein